MELLFSLPDWDFVGGSTQKRIFTMTSTSGVVYDYPGSSASISIIEYVNRGTPVLTKTATVGKDANGKYCEVTVALSPSETLNMCGKYIYQLSIKDAAGNYSIPMYGAMHVADNINKAFVK